MNLWNYIYLILRNPVRAIVPSSFDFWVDSTQNCDNTIRCSVVRYDVRQSDTTLRRYGHNIALSIRKYARKYARKYDTTLYNATRHFDGTVAILYRTFALSNYKFKSTLDDTFNATLDSALLRRYRRYVAWLRRASYRSCKVDARRNLEPNRIP